MSLQEDGILTDGGAVEAAGDFAGGHSTRESSSPSEQSLCTTFFFWTVATVLVHV
jgi:hypothetical protein